MSKIGKIFLYNMISNISFFKLHVLCKSSSLRLIDDEDCFFTATKGMNYQFYLQIRQKQVLSQVWN